MKIRLFIENIDNDTIKIIDKNYHYLNNVLRVKISDILFVFNEKEEWECVVSDINKKYIILQKQNIIKINDKINNITAAIPFIKPDTLHTMIRQSVELGVEKICIFNAFHSSVRHINLDKINILIIEALEQCRGIYFPKIEVFNSLEHLLLNNIDKNILYSNEKSDSNTENIIPKILDNIFVIVGPEGGFSNIELTNLSNQKNSVSINLGNRILRSDTALVNMICLAKTVYK